ncbi:hypothetical protein ACM46_13120 [Chryseobacterium angstadtii]|uniref:Cytochrome B561 n=1 Tax=Chryseobacterium angstadtii TaxID=558151 RepID=A0A0J7IFB0_9FLAO|nr:hypothetical protein [Chryseobacterium angstadtii]KMQ65123.1 hypothetical protein ACM46_13120 [Chryseobacterium angstadtii]
MYQTFTFLHSAFRWVVLISLIYSIWRAYKGYFTHKIFSKTDDLARHWTATIAHIQLILGIILYTKSPVVKYFWKNFSEAKSSIDVLFFGLIHFLIMITAIILITVGSAMAKRKETDKEKYKTMLIWFVTALILIFLAIPWPFSPIVNRPYFRSL